MGVSTARVSEQTTSVTAFERVAALATRRAQALDEAGEPLAEVEALAETGLLTLPFSPSFGGGGLACGEAAARILPMALRVLGRASLPLGRLYEGHVNAIRLVESYGSIAQRARMADEARRGASFGVWAADENEEGLRISPRGMWFGSGGSQDLLLGGWPDSDARSSQPRMRPTRFE